jgi:hypothetical protein
MVGKVFILKFSLKISHIFSKTNNIVNFARAYTKTFHLFTYIWPTIKTHKLLTKC